MTRDIHRADNRSALDSTSANRINKWGTRSTEPRPPLNFVSKNPIETALAEALAGVVQPAWIIDVQRGQIVASNGRGTAVWGIPVMTPALESTVPALRALRTRLASRPLTHHAPADQAATELLKFWTCAGLRGVLCTIHLLDESVGPGLLMVVAESGPRSAIRLNNKSAQLDAQAFWGAPPIPASFAPPAREPAPPRAAPAQIARNAGMPLSDAETMREIARRIRQGSGVSDEPRIAEGRDDRTAETTPPIRQDVAPMGRGGAAPFDVPAHLAHEIRTPLAAIVSLAEVITEERLGPWPNERYRSYIRDILDSARHGLDVVDGILREAPGQAGATPDLAEVDLNAEVEAICTSLQPLAEKSGARLQAALVSGLERVTADRRNIRQMLLNLISNSIAHGGLSVRIKVTTGYELGGDVWVEVEDNGRGMPASGTAQPDPSRSGKGTRTDNRGRKAGLGLPLTRALATANGARLDISSKPGRGVRARIVFGGDSAARRDQGAG